MLRCIVVRLINSYTERMEAIMTAWFRAILAQVRRVFPG
jgi:hypothetical protein